MKYGLIENTIERIQNILAEQPEIEQAILYGSRAKGNFRPGSDIDLTILGKDTNLSTVNRLQLQIDELNLPYTFDISVYRHIRDEGLIEHIKRVGISFYLKADQIS